MKTLMMIAAVAALCAAPAAHALDFQLVSHLGDDWTYTLTYDPNNNMWWEENGNIHSQIRLSGLYGVIGVTGPTSTDFPSPINEGQLLWDGSVSFGGQVVDFTMNSEDVGTGNFASQKHVFGFTLTAPNAVETDKISLDTNGFYDGHSLEDRDVHKLINGPGAPALPVPEPATWALLAFGTAALAVGLRHRKPGAEPGR